MMKMLRDSQKDENRRASESTQPFITLAKVIVFMDDVGLHRIGKGKKGKRIVSLAV
jgi:hypothetical protein